MRVDDLKGKKIVIWGTGKEGQASAALILDRLPNQPFVFVDEGEGPEIVTVAGHSFPILRGQKLASALFEADTVVKSPGVSLYHPLLKASRAAVTSLLNLWMAEPKKARVIGITGTKGKSTTATLLTHVLNSMNQKAAVAGNIGTPVTECNDNVDYFVVEVSSYQAANFTETFNVGVLVSLFPEHLNWHGTLDKYYRDKANLLSHSKRKIVGADAAATLASHGIDVAKDVLFGVPDVFHIDGSQVFQGAVLIGSLTNSFLLRAHNHGNVCAVLSVIAVLGLNAEEALNAMAAYKGLPHRQCELGEKDGVLYVDDSISTTPQSAIAAMEAFTGPPLTLIAGGFDRAIDYAPLADYIAHKKINAVVCLGDSGKRIYDLLQERNVKNATLVSTMQEAVNKAKQSTPKGGIILLSPAAPSYGMFKNFEERAAVFADVSGF
ncbi:MAG: UDP-N-acetylmuramoyl-L-alanine--D-glutamate ligase [Alphaproteobacteria bacterium]|nr:UDP-N-acetylmuramoyl-L-alanine--D-glutamate ligase [Alphaproteobacteria bacterium]